MPRLSSTTLFNFTDSIDYLINNLNEGIYCHNTFEKLPFKNNAYRVPMACFCDIPLSMIKEHFDWYGRYGIGVSRTYARSLGVKPVWYVTSESKLVRNLVRSSAIRPYERKHMVPYLKKFMGNQFFQKQGKERRKKFYDEREWRFIPGGSKVETFFSLGSHETIPAAIQNAERMPLDLNEIEYIIIENEEDFDRILKELKSIGDRDEHLKPESLIAKLITAKQIERDF